MSIQPTADDIDRWSKQFEADPRMNEALSQEVQYALTKALSDAEIKIHSCTSRVKSLSSFQGKIIRKGYADPLTDMHDLVGARVVCLFAEDLAKVEQIIRQYFKVTRYENK